MKNLTFIYSLIKTINVGGMAVALIQVKPLHFLLSFIGFLFFDYLQIKELQDALCTSDAVGSKS